MATIEELCREHDLLRLGEDGVIRVPFLVKGTLRIPPVVGMEKILEAFSDKEKATGKPPKAVTMVRLEDAQVVREPVMNRETMRTTDEFVYQVLTTCYFTYINPFIFYGLILAFSRNRREFISSNNGFVTV